jgi:hypothetical protein
MEDEPTAPSISQESESYANRRRPGTSEPTPDRRRAAEDYVTANLLKEQISSVPSGTVYPTITQASDEET